MPDIIRKASAHAQPGDDPLEYVMSDESVDRVGDVIEAKGWSLNAFRNNPVALFGHDSRFVIGKWTDVRVEKDRLVGKLDMLGKGISSRIDELHAAVEAGVLRAVSVGFRPLEKPKLRDEKDYSAGYIFSKQELMECSLVAVPANPNALQIAKGLGLSEQTMSMMFGETAERTKAVHIHGTSADPKPSFEGRSMSLSEKVQSAQEYLNFAKETLETHVSTEAEPDLAKLDELTEKVNTAQRHYDTLKKAETALAQYSQPTSGGGSMQLPAVFDPRRVPAMPAKKVDPFDFFLKALATHVVARATKTPEEIILHKLYGDGRYGNAEDIRSFASMLVNKTATAPATTTTSGWASQLIETFNTGYMGLLMPASVFPGLSARGLQLSFGRSGQINIPSRASTPTIAGAFVLEGNPIPVKQGAFTSQQLTPKKMAVISTFTREIGQHSTPTIETLIRDAIQEDTSVSIDSVLLDATAASATRPAGIRNGVSVTTATAGGGFTALVGDLKALLGALITATNGNLRAPTWIMNPVQTLAISVTQNAGGDFPFAAEINQNRFMGYSVIESSNVTAGMVILIDAADFVSVGGDPMFDVSDTATIHMEDTTPLAIGTVGSPNTVAAPTRSLWQTDTIGIRMIMPLNWTLRRTGVLAWTQSVTW